MISQVEDARWKVCPKPGQDSLIIGLRDPWENLKFLKKQSHVFRF